MKDFYIWLFSNASSELFTQNKISDFRVQLPNSLDLDKEEYQVGLTECSYTQSNKIFPDDTKSKQRLIETIVWDVDSDGIKRNETLYEYYIEGNPSNMRELVTNLNLKFNQAFLRRHNRRVEFSVNDKQCIVDVHTANTNVKVSEKLLSILGFEENTVFDRKKQESIYTPDFYAGAHSMILYSDVCVNFFVSDRSVPILRSIVNDTTIPPNKRVLHTFERPYYLDLRSGYITSIHISARTESGDPFLFDRGVLSLVLSFKAKI